MDHGEHAVGASFQQNGENLVVAQLQGGVGHVDLERGDTFIAVDDGEPLQCLLAWVSDEHVETVVAVAVFGGPHVRLPECLEKRGLRLLLGRKAHDSRAPSGHSRACPGLVGIRGSALAEHGGLFEVDVAVDAAWLFILSAGSPFPRS